MRIVAISDTHHRYFNADKSLRLKIPDGDVLVCAGDISMMGTADQIAKYGEWLDWHNHKLKITVPGNHDWLFQRDPKQARKLVPGTVLIDEGIEFWKVKFWGSPWQPEFGHWAFNLPRGIRLAEKWKLILQGTDVLITHGPPFGRLDWTKGYEDSPKEQVGCVDLANRVDKVRPKVHVFGHIHCSYGVLEADGTKFVNASICNEKYDHANAPVIIDI